MNAVIRIAVLLVIGGALSAAGAAAVFLLLLQGAAPAPHGSVSAVGLGAKVRVLRDPLGVAHIEAKSRRDGFLGLGFAHAQDRLWQMEVMRRASRGTLSEVFGSTTLPYDRLARTLGLYRTAVTESAGLRIPTRAALEAYVAGVNLWMEELRAGRAEMPLEFRWLGVEPEDWTSADSLALLRLRAWMIGKSLSAALLMQRFTHELGGVASQDFFPVPPLEQEPELVGSVSRLGIIADRWARRFGLSGPVGSLGFVIGSERAAAGSPLLANDVHLGFQLPAVFYLAHLALPELELSGGTWPGIPVFWMGTNKQIAWGQVAIHASASDLYDEALHPSDRLLYDAGGRWVAAEKRTERIDVRYRKTEQLEIVTTRHGPLLGAVRPEDPSIQSYALRWAGQGPSSGIEALLGLQRARGWKDFRRALREFPAPVSTFLYADVEGNIGQQVAGHFPVRSIETGLLPVPGGTRYYDWRGYIPFDQLPRSFGNDIPWIVVSTRPRRDAFPRPVTWLWEHGGGAERVEALLSASSTHSLADAVAIQRDRNSTRGVAVVRRLLKGVSVNSQSAERVQRLLLEWDGSTEAEVLGVSVYHVFRERLTERLLAQRLGDESGLRQLIGDLEPIPGVLLARFLERVGASESAELVEAALEETWSWLAVEVSSNPARWAWGRVHRLRLEHPFERLGGPWLRLFGRPLGRGPFASPGDPDSVWTMHHRSLTAARVAIGPVIRYAVDLGDVSHARFGLAGGQSGHPGTPHYADALEDWLGGRSRPLWMHRGDVAYHERGIWEIHPNEERPPP